MFRRLHEPANAVTIQIDGSPVRAAPGDSVAAALLATGNPVCRQSPASGADRAPFCMIGACFECLMEIDGVPNRQACLVPVREGMQVRRQARPTPVGAVASPADKVAS
ncbi:MAG: (2Fe-2S)-binding protein [Alphaproteobacteria bacterium]|nr:(2Fe-2S)-binding protein [Alphaproteobacteria bacterium]